MKTKTTVYLVIVTAICTVLLFVLIVPDSGLAQKEALAKWVRLNPLPSGELVGCQDTAEYECGILCGKQYADPSGVDVTPLGCVAFRFPISDLSEPGTAPVTESTHLPIIKTEGTED
jgi:hypothetical protein